MTAAQVEAWRAATGSNVMALIHCLFARLASCKPLLEQAEHAHTRRPLVYLPAHRQSDNAAIPASAPGAEERARAGVSGEQPVGADASRVQAAGTPRQDAAQPDALAADTLAAHDPPAEARVEGGGGNRIPDAGEGGGSRVDGEGGGSRVDGDEGGFGLGTSPADEQVCALSSSLAFSPIGKRASEAGVYCK